MNTASRKMTATEIDFDALDDGIIMVPAFESIKSCDDDDDDSFSRTLILKFFSQANDVVPELADLLYAPFPRFLFPFPFLTVAHDGCHVAGESGISQTSPNARTT